MLGIQPEVQVVHVKSNTCINSPNSHKNQSLNFDKAADKQVTAANYRGLVCPDLLREHSRNPSAQPIHGMNNPGTVTHSMNGLCTA